MHWIFKSKEYVGESGHWATGHQTNGDYGRVPYYSVLVKTFPKTLVNSVGKIVEEMLNIITISIPNKYHVTYRKREARPKCKN